MNHAEAAKELLVYYFQQIAAKAGMKWHMDYTLEIEQAIDHILAAAMEAVRQQAEADRLIAEGKVPSRRDLLGGY